MSSENPTCPECANPLIVFEQSTFRYWVSCQTCKWQFGPAPERPTAEQVAAVWERQFKHMRCRECVSYKKVDGRFQCTHNPPPSHSESRRQGFPFVDPQDWCGLFERVPQPKPKRRFWRDLWEKLTFPDD